MIITNKVIQSITKKSYSAVVFLLFLHMHRQGTETKIFAKKL